MFVPDEPRFRPGWFRLRAPVDPPWIGDEEWVPHGVKGLYARARSGLWAVAREAFPEGATVLLPAYIPRSVVQAFRYGDVDVRYYPVEPNLRLPGDRVRDRIETENPDGVLFVHYFGFADPAFDDLAAAARDAGVTVLEDCARSLFGRHTDGTLLGSTGDYALFSLHKVLPIPNGGLVVASDPEVRFPTPDGVRAEYRDAVVAVVLRALEVCDVNPAKLEGPAGPDRGASGKPSGPNSAVELEFSTAAPGRLSRIGLGVTDPSTVVSARRRRYAELRSELASIDGTEVLTPPLHDGACPFGVAVRFPDGEATRDRVYERLHRAGLPCLRLRWWLRPDEQDPGAYAGARTVRRQLLVVPTHHQVPRGIGADVAERVVDAIDV